MYTPLSTASAVCILTLLCDLYIIPIFIVVVELVSKFELPEIRKDLQKLSTTAEEDGEVCIYLYMCV